MLRLIPALFLAGCLLPTNNGADTAALSGGGGEWSGAGSLSDRDITVDWWWESSWGTGACVKMMFYNNGSERSAVQANISLKGEISSWIGGYGPDVTTPAPDQVSVEMTSGMAAGEAVEAVYCAEPLTEPADLVIFATDGSNNNNDTDTEDTPPDQPISGTLYTEDHDFGLSYQGGADHGGTSAECLLVRFWNFSGTDIDDWTATIDFDGPTTVAYRWSLTVFEESDGGFSSLKVIPESPIAPIDSGESVEAGLCLEPMARPVTLTFSPN